MARFFQGYLYPSYTGGVVSTFKSANAEAAWAALKDLWQHVSPTSTSIDFMQEALLAGDVLIGFDHIARVKDALTTKPNDFVAFPAPAGPKGRGFMPVLAGLGVTKGAPNRAGATTVIDHLTKPETQLITAAEVGFFPVVKADLPPNLPAGVKMIAAAIQATTSASDAMPSLLPVGLGAKGGEFNKVYMDAFQRIVLRNEPITAVLEDQAKVLSNLMAETKAPCWAPDKASTGPCPVN
jgi:multiple sugar transport system substrate-binding protein